jgi:ribosome biogenesis GTPase A
MEEGMSTATRAGPAAPSVTPFEKNLDVWRQLWRVVERSDVLVQIVDARMPTFYQCVLLSAQPLLIM